MGFALSGFLSSGFWALGGDWPRYEVTKTSYMDNRGNSEANT